jgi:hypothetical protein
MDLAYYGRGVFERVKNEYGPYLSKLGVKPAAFVPMSTPKTCDSRADLEGLGDNSFEEELFALLKSILRTSSCEETVSYR